MKRARPLCFVLMGNRKGACPGFPKSKVQGPKSKVMIGSYVSTGSDRVALGYSSNFNCLNEK